MVTLLAFSLDGKGAPAWTLNLPDSVARGRVAAASASLIAAPAVGITAQSGLSVTVISNERAYFVAGGGLMSNSPSPLASPTKGISTTAAGSNDAPASSSLAVFVGVICAVIFLISARYFCVLSRPKSADAKSSASKNAAVFPAPTDADTAPQSVSPPQSNSPSSAFTPTQMQSSAAGIISPGELTSPGSKKRSITMAIQTDRTDTTRSRSRSRSLVSGRHSPFLVDAVAVDFTSYDHDEDDIDALNRG
jgi:hypothetical protein